MKLPVAFAGEYNERTARQISYQTAINMYAEVSGKSFIMRQRYGMLLNQTVGVGPYRGGMTAYGLMFFVNNNTVYKMDTAQVVTSIGTVNTYSGRVSMDSNGLELVIVDGTDGFAYEYATGTFTQITDPDFVAVKPVQVRFLDGFFLIFKPGTGEFYKSISYPTHAQLTTADTGWSALDFENAQSSPDNITSMEILHQQIVLLGDDTTEFFTNTNNPIFPYERQPGGVSEWGIHAPFSVGKVDNGIIWLAKNKEGHGHVMQATGYAPTVISNKGIEDAIEGMVSSTDAYAMVFKEGNHLLYVLTFPSGNKTFVYDLTTKLWHERQSFGTGRWRAGMHIFFNSKHYLGDSISGKLYTLEKDVYSDDGTEILRIIRTEHEAENQEKLTCHELQLLCVQGTGLIQSEARIYSQGEVEVTVPAKQGSNPQIALRWSNDRGMTYGNTHSRSLGKIGEYNWRTRWTNCGSYYNRTWEASVSDPVSWTVIGAYGRFSKGLA